MVRHRGPFSHAAARSAFRRLTPRGQLKFEVRGVSARNTPRSRRRFARGFPSRRARAPNKERVERFIAHLPFRRRRVTMTTISPLGAPAWA